MPNTYVRKSNRASWSENDLKNAHNAVLNNILSLRRASKQFNIPEKNITDEDKK